MRSQLSSFDKGGNRFNMKINNRLYLKLVFYIAGTAILLLLLTTAGINFAADSSLFEEPLLVAEGNGEDINMNNGVTNGNGSVDGTLYYNRRVNDSNSGSQAVPSADKASASASVKASGTAAKTSAARTASATAKASASPAQDTNGNGGNGDNGGLPDTDPTKMKIEIINYSGVGELAEEIKGLLTAAGYTSEIRNEDFAAVLGTTTIIDRSKTDIGEKIRDVIMAGRIEKGNGSNVYIATIIIGQDLIP